MKTTEWFSAKVKPVHIGVYEVKRFYLGGHKPMELHKLHWDGKGWTYAEPFSMSAKGSYASMRPQDGDMWRGLKTPN